jgi:DNA-binding XRE family transcriptional regulator
VVYGVINPLFEGAGGMFMTIEEYRIRLVWPAAELARRAKISPQTLARMESGEPVQLISAAAVAKALSDGLGERITINDLDGVKIVGRDV